MRENEQKLTLSDILHMSANHENNIGEISDEMYDKLILEELPKKVDSIYMFFSKQNSEIKRLRVEAGKLKLEADYLKKSGDRLLEHLIYTLKKMKIKGINGSNYRIQLRESESVKELVSPTNELYLKNELITPGLVKRTFAFDKSKLKDEIKIKKNKQLKEYAEIVSSLSINLSVKKGMK